MLYSSCRRVPSGLTSKKDRIMSTVEISKEKRESVQPYKARASKILAINAGGLWNKSIEIGNHKLYISDHDPFPTWIGTLCKKCGGNIYAHLELRESRPEDPVKGVNRPYDTLLCPSEWIVVDGMDNLTIMSEKAFLEAYKPV